MPIQKIEYFYRDDNKDRENKRAKRTLSIFSKKNDAVILSESLALLLSRSIEK